MKTCPACRRELSLEDRFCTSCGRPQEPEAPAQTHQDGEPALEEMNITALYVMIGALILALLFPPWESPPGSPPEFLGLHFCLSPPEPDAVVSRLVMTVELTTIGIAGLYCSWLLRKRR